MAAWEAADLRAASCSPQNPLCRTDPPCCTPSHPRMIARTSWQRHCRLAPCLHLPAIAACTLCKWCRDMYQCWHASWGVCRCCDAPSRLLGDRTAQAPPCWNVRDRAAGLGREDSRTCLAPGLLDAAGALLTFGEVWPLAPLCVYRCTVGMGFRHIRSVASLCCHFRRLRAGHTCTCQQRHFCIKTKFNLHMTNTRS